MKPSPECTTCLDFISKQNINTIDAITIASYLLGSCISGYEQMFDESQSQHGELDSSELS